jgi:hypothetical protein
MICGWLDSVQRTERLEIIRNSALALPDALFLERGYPVIGGQHERAGRCEHVSAPLSAGDLKLASLALISLTAWPGAGFLCVALQDLRFASRLGRPWAHYVRGGGEA